MKDIKILYLFENYGAPAPEFVLENHLWVDVGNALKDGAFDHHQDKRFPCSFQTIVENTEFSKKAIEYVKAHEIPEVVIHVHKYPDIDCISSVFLLQKMLEKQTTNLKELFSERTLESLCKYVSAIDAGKKKDLTVATLYAYWMRLKDVVEEKNRSQAWILKKGIQLFAEVVGALEKAEAEIDLFHMALSEYIPVERLEEPAEENSERKTEYYRKIQEIQKKEWADYESDKKKGILKFEKIQMLNKKTGQIDKITAGIWTQMPTGKNGYYYARKYDNCMLTVFPTSIRNERDVPEATTEVIISLNPDIEGYENYSLLVLAEVLEQLEQIEEEHYLSENGIYKRNHNRSRSKEGRFSKEPFAPTDDPWFITAEEDMIAVPREGSLIPYQRICTLVQSISNVIKTLEIVSYQNESEALVMKKDKYEHITFGELYEITRNKILNIQKSEKTEYLFVYAEIDSAVLKYSNVLLRECCLNMVGKSFPNRATDKILDIDYRTCLYTDRSITILAAAESTELERRGLMSEKLEDSKICQDIWLLLKRRKQLSDIGNHLAEKMQLIYDEADEISNFNTRLVRLNAEMEKDDLITDSLEQEIYFFMKNILGIDRLRASVNTSAELVIQNAEHQNEKAEKARDERTQRILGIVSILAVVSAMLDAKELLGVLMGGGWKAFLDPKSLLCYVELTIVIIGVLGIYWTLIAPWWDNHKGRIRKK